MPEPDQPPVTEPPLTRICLPRTSIELAALRFHVWATTPKHLRAVINGQQCRWVPAVWVPLNEMLGIELLSFVGEATQPL